MEPLQSKALQYVLFQENIIYAHVLELIKRAVNAYSVTIALQRRNVWAVILCKAWLILTSWLLFIWFVRISKVLKLLHKYGHWNTPEASPIAVFWIPTTDRTKMHLLVTVELWLYKGCRLVQNGSFLCDTRRHPGLLRRSECCTGCCCSSTLSLVCGSIYCRSNSLQVTAVLV